MVAGDVVVRRLAVEDIDDLWAEPAANGRGCGVQVTRHAFSDSARVEGPLGDGVTVAIAANRTGSIVRDADGRTRSSGQDAMIRIYSSARDDGLDLVASVAREGAVAVAIDEYPGRVEFEDEWAFVAR